MGPLHASTWDLHVCWTLVLLIYLLGSLPISHFLSLWSASVNQSLLSYLPGTMNTLGCRGEKNLNGSEAMMERLKF